MSLFVVEITAAVDDLGATQTFLLSEVSWSTGPADTPAHTPVDGGLLDPGTLGVSLFSDGRTSGETRLETGSLVLNNTDGRLDGWAAYGFDGRPVVIRMGERGAPYPASFKTILTATIEGGPDFSLSTVGFQLKDKNHVLDKLVQNTRYLGTNSGSTGLEGTASDIKGKVKPRVYGRVFNMAAAPANTANLTYQVSDRAVEDIPNVWDAGVALTKATNHANAAALVAATVTSGQYHTCFAEGLFRLGALPTGEVTCNVNQSTTATAAEIMAALAQDCGLSPAEIHPTAVYDLNTANAALCGIFLGEEITGREAMDLVAPSVGAAYWFDRPGLLRFGRLQAPTGLNPVIELTEGMCKSIERRPPDDQAVPIWSTKVNQSRVWQVQESGLAGSAPAGHRAIVANQYRSSVAENAAVKLKYLQAGTLEVDTLLATTEAGDAEAARLVALHGVARSFYDVVIPLDLLPDGLELMKEAKLTMDRFGLQGGGAFLITGLRIELARRQAVLTLWG